MNRTRLAALTLLLFGIVLLGLGWEAYHSMGSDVSRLFTGTPTDRALLLLVGGGLLSVAGLGGLSHGTK